MIDSKLIRSLRGMLPALALAGALAGGPCGDAPAAASELRRSAIVVAVEKARPSVVNIRGEKLVAAETGLAAGEPSRRVNGMGTGIVIDPRGWILTNHHVVEGVESLQVTLDGGRTFPARVLAADPSADLALLKLENAGRLPVITIGTARDLMLGETVIAVGNPYGYEHTITRGIISALHRSVQVTDTQSYDDLVQTDASINPGNSGGPLLNVDGEVVGLAVAVRAGAQGIGFAIPIDKAMSVAARLLTQAEGRRNWHGMAGEDLANASGVRLSNIAPNSPAAQCGLKPGDVITAVDGHDVARWLDVERTAFERDPGSELTLNVERDGQPLCLSLVLGKAPTNNRDSGGPTWSVLGLRLQPVAAEALRAARTRYRGGLYVREVRPGSPADKQGIRRGDILLGMHVWETVSLDNMDYILNRPDFNQLEPVKFFILRGNETLYGHMRVSGQE